VRARAAGGEKKYIIKYENFRNIMAYKNISKKLSDE